ncbi:single-stranded DNA exonuclease RecJ, partial [Microbacteriaceae bacterium]|nr:single-stranded DNA exonuclease RecJ [Candidatus Saccharibacteria bacterium]
MTLFEKILEARALSGELKESFLHPRYEMRHDPFLLPDMEKAVERLVIAHSSQEHIMIYGDYDI